MSRNKRLYDFLEEEQWVPPKGLPTAIGLLCVISFVTRFLIVESSPIIMDEFVDTQLACQVARGHSLYADGGYYFRTPFMVHAISWFCGGASDSFGMVLIARRLMWLCSAVATLLTYLVARRTFGPAVALFALLLLCSFTTFLDRSLHVRADMVATMFSSWALYFATFSVGWMFFVAGLFLGFAFMTTQKAVYVVVAFAVGITFRYAVSSRNFSQFARKALKVGLLSALGLFLVVLGYGALIWSDGHIENFTRKCFGEAMKAGFVSEVYDSTWVYLWLTMMRNPIIWYYGLLAIFLTVYDSIRARRISLEKGIRLELVAMLGAWGLTQFIFTLTHDVKFPYFYLNIAPVLVVCASVPVARFFRSLCSAETVRLRMSNIVNWVFIALFVALLIVLPAVRHMQNLNNPKIAIQKEIVSRVDAITDPDDAVLDGVGMITTRRKATPFSMTARFFTRRQKGYDYNVIDWVTKTAPKVLIDNYRLQQLEKHELEFLMARFVHDWSNVWVVGSHIPSAGGRKGVEFFDLLASAQYVVLCKDLTKVWIDGKPARARQFLSAGRHLIKIGGSNEAVTVKYAPAVLVPPPSSPDRVVALFPSYRD